MEVYNVILDTEIRCYGGDITFGEFKKTDLGLFANLLLADEFIEANAQKELEKAMMNGDGAWIGAWEKENDITTINDGWPCERKKIMIERRNAGDTYIYTYLIQQRIIIKEA